VGRSGRPGDRHGVAPLLHAAGPGWVTTSMAGRDPGCSGWLAGALAGILVLLPAGVLPAPLTETGRRAYETARKADDGATGALEEGDKSLARVRALVPERERVPEALRPLLEEAEAAYHALTGYRRLAQASATDALGLLADVSKLPAIPAPDPVRRDTLEQHALLAAHEAAVMAARARAEAERLRAIVAEARLAMAEPASAGRPARAASASRLPGPGVGPGVRAGGEPEAVVPNLIGARFDAAVRDLEAVGLRLGTVTGPRDGFVVKQIPEAGAGAPRQSAVDVTLSATAATIAPPR
jgi:hypothetical protein